MREIKPYGVTQNPDAEAVTANELVGTRVESIGANAVGEGVAPAGGWSTAPYVPPTGAGPKGCYGNRGTCGAPALKGGRYCYFHSDEAK